MLLTLLLVSQPPLLRGRSIARTNKYPEFTQFVSDIIERAEVTVADILDTLVYI